MVVAHQTVFHDAARPSHVLIPMRPVREEGDPMKLSARNQLTGTVVTITRGEAIANVVLDVGGQRIVSSITVEAVDDLGLKEGSSATAVIKASDVMIGIDA